MDSDTHTQNQNPSNSKLKVHLVTCTDSAEFTLLSESLSRTSVVGLDAEWKPVRRSFPRVSVLQIACGDSTVFVLDLLSLPLSSLWQPLRELLLSPDIFKLGFGFKQDLVYLSSTFSSHGGFDKVEPYLDIKNVYNHLQHNKKHVSKQSKSLSTICAEVLGFTLSKELQCSDWSCRPLTEEQITYAAMDAHILLDIFKVFQAKVVKEGDLILETTVLSNPDANLGLKDLFRNHDISDKVLRAQFHEALAIVQATTCSDVAQMIPLAGGMIQKSSCWVTVPMDEDLLKVVKKYGDKILLKESDRKPKSSKKKGKKQTLINGINKENHFEKFEWQGTPPWDPSVGGNGYPKFLCDVMVEGLAKHLRCVGIDAAIPYSKKPEPRMLIEHAQKEKRVILTRDAKLLRHDYLTENQIYRVKSLLKNEQLLEVIETFQLKINEDKLMSRCTKCNGTFIQKPLTTEEAIEAAKGFQRIPNCLFNKNLEFWQCMDCHQLYWEGTQYHNAVQKFIDICKLSD
ncbi:Werner syndrome ATP-dependent helicase homolog isoform X1 [Cajanus cajan]|uniref:Exonuclease mut-7 isogeny n=1 Tax=Cajanus cajan TaxID=3821 RepID=A0A151TVU6_CAJCA|nr:Werner syndrome ATP-dependent helicase homolog isoform X1 [Cajanus cajan]KYP71131.1 putative exonuclease mut-7 isogeny [Cajanus cajan]